MLAALAGMHFGRDPLATLRITNRFERLLLTAAVEKAGEMRQAEAEAE